MEHRRFFYPVLSLLLVFVLFVSLPGCGAAFAEDPVILADQAVREVTLNGDGASFDCGGVTVSGSTITIGAPGIYSFTGTLNDGQIRVSLNDDEQAKLIFSGVSITSRNDAAVFVANADKVTLEIADGTESTVVSGTAESAAAFDAARTGAAIYSAVDLKFSGSGTLRVTGNLNNGIGSKKDLDIKNCTMAVEAVNNGLKGNNSVEISGASLLIRAGNDGIKTDTQKEGKGYVTIVSSSLEIIAAKGITADGEITFVP